MRMSVDPLVIGIDASPLRIGYAIAHQERIRAFGIFHTKTSPLEQRVTAWRDIRQAARMIEDATRRDVSAVFVEDAWFGPNRRGTLLHAMSIGQVCALAYQAFQVEPRLISPQTWRSRCGLPQRGKEPAMRFATELVEDSDISRISRISQDEADAITIAIAGLRILISEDE